jgi:hypothetical protein
MGIRNRGQKSRDQNQWKAIMKEPAVEEEESYKSWVKTNSLEACSVFIIRADQINMDPGNEGL